MTKISKPRYVFYILIILCSIVIMYMGFARHMRFFLVPSSSMEPTLYPKDYILTLNASEYRRGDIIVLDDPMRKNEYLVKRIVAVGGDEVSVGAGCLFVNGVYASEPYTVEPMVYEVSPPVKVPPGEVYVLGDNRNASEDSSTWRRPDGFATDEGVAWEKPTVPTASIIGKVHYIYLPGARRGRVESFPLDAMLTR
jgi:signal peptidase I